MTSKEALECIIYRLTAQEDDLELRETAKVEIEIIKKDLDRLEKLNHIFSDNHICEIKARFNEIECDADKCDTCPLGFESDICLKLIIERKWELQEENFELRQKLNTEEECSATLEKKLKEIKKEIEDGTLSDGYHTFNDLYYQRLILFATIVNKWSDKAWKSSKHENGELCFGGGWFIVGIDTPKGSYTYHYENKYWNMFDCKTLDKAKKWDGHTSKDVERLLSLNDEEVLKYE